MPDISMYVPQTGVSYLGLDGVRHEAAVMSNDGTTMKVYEVMASGRGTKSWDASDDEEDEDRCKLPWCSAMDNLPFTETCKKSLDYGGDGTCYVDAGPDDLVELSAKDAWRDYMAVQDGAMIPDSDYLPLLDHFSRHVLQRERTAAEIFAEVREGAAREAMDLSGIWPDADGPGAEQDPGDLTGAFLDAIAVADPATVPDWRSFCGGAGTSEPAVQPVHDYDGATERMKALLASRDGEYGGRQDSGPDFG